MKILYHYCSTASFHAIVRSHVLWLSSLSLSNDTLEGKLVASAISRLAVRDSLGEDQVRRIQSCISFLENSVDGLGFCLSQDGDILSQWRGYAENATGVAIGFSVEYLKWLSEASLNRTEPGFFLQNVEYSPSAHEALVEPAYIKVREGIKTPGLINTIGMTDQERAASQEWMKRSFLASMYLIPELFRLKSYAFREECEWRILSHLVKNGEDVCLHRAVGSRIVPYREIALVELERSPIVEVILGPKHGTPPKIVEDFLKLNQYGDVKVCSSEASYR